MDLIITSTGALKCATCAEITRRELPTDSHSRFVRGLLFGVGGAILGLIIYSTFGIVTGLVVGYLSLAVGYIVGKAIHMGSRGSGGQAANALAKSARFILLASALVFGLVAGQGIFFLVAAGFTDRLFTKDLPPLPSSSTLIYYLTLLAAYAALLHLLPAEPAGATSPQTPLPHFALSRIRACVLYFETRPSALFAL
jgi:hypothetical protein